MSTINSNGDSYWEEEISPPPTKKKPKNSPLRKPLGKLETSMKTLSMGKKKMKATLKNKLVSYSKDSSRDPSDTSSSLEDSHSSHLTTDRENRPSFSTDLKSDEHYFKLDRQSLDDVLSILKNSAVDLFRVFKWVFHEIKDLNLKNREASSKLEELVEKV